MHADAGFCGSAWDAAYTGFGVPSGVKVIVSCDKKNNGAEMRVLASDGQLLTQIVREYDLAGRPLEEKPLWQNVAFLMLGHLAL